MPNIDFPAAPLDEPLDSPSDKQVIEALVKALEQVKSLLDDHILIRDISHDDDYARFMVEGVRVTKMVYDAIAALALAKRQ